MHVSICGYALTMGSTACGCGGRRCSRRVWWWVQVQVAVMVGAGSGAKGSWGPVAVRRAGMPAGRRRRRQAHLVEGAVGGADI